MRGDTVDMWSSNRDTVVSCKVPAQVKADLIVLADKYGSNVNRLIAGIVMHHLEYAQRFPTGFAVLNGRVNPHSKAVLEVVQKEIKECWEEVNDLIYENRALAKAIDDLRKVHSVDFSEIDARIRKRLFEARE